MKFWRLDGTQGAGNGLTRMAIVEREWYYAGNARLRVARRRGLPSAPESRRLLVGAWPVQSEHRKRSEAGRCCRARELLSLVVRPPSASSRQADTQR